ncbi:MAG: HDOD domain-containing protein [Planctomycetota bacterium]
MPVVADPAESLAGLAGFAKGSSALDGDRAIDPRIEPLFSKLGGLCSLPAVAQQVIQVADDPDADAGDLVDVIEQDPAVAVRLMQVVNSAYCGLRNPVGDLRTAVTMLGSERVGTLALTVSIGAMFSRDTPVGRFDPERLWDHSVCVATVSRHLAARVAGVHPDEAYLAGLLHDLGLLFITQHLEPLTPKVLVRVEAGGALAVAEREVMGFDHAQVGAYVAWRANLPETLVGAIDYHHDPLSCPKACQRITRVVSLANYLATRHGRGSIEGRRLPAPPEGVLQPLGVDLHSFRSMWSELPHTLAGVEELTRR